MTKASEIGRNEQEKGRERSRRVIPCKRSIFHDRIRRDRVACRNFAPSIRHGICSSGKYSRSPDGTEETECSRAIEGGCGGHTRVGRSLKLGRMKAAQEAFRKARDVGIGIR